MSDQPEDWDDLEAWEAELEGLEPGLEDGEDRPKRRWRGIIWVVLAVTLLAFIWYVWVAALLNPDNYRLPVTPTPPVTPWEQGEAPFDLEEREDIGSLITLGFLLPSFSTDATPDDVESDCAGQACVGGGGLDLQQSGRGSDLIAGDSGDTSAWLALWIGAHVLLQAVGLVTIARRRHKMGTRLVVKWTLLILLIPVAGVLGYYFYLLEGSIQRGVPGRREQAASFLRSPLEKT